MEQGGRFELPITRFAAARFCHSASPAKMEGTAVHSAPERSVAHDCRRRRIPDLDGAGYRIRTGLKRLAVSYTTTVLSPREIGALRGIRTPVAAFVAQLPESAGKGEKRFGADEETRTPVPGLEGQRPTDWTTSAQLFSCQRSLSCRPRQDQPHIVMTDPTTLDSRVIATLAEASGFEPENPVLETSSLPTSLCLYERLG